MGRLFVHITKHKVVIWDVYLLKITKHQVVMGRLFVQITKHKVSIWIVYWLKLQNIR
jgi:hypothetical protein